MSVNSLSPNAFNARGASSSAVQGSTQFTPTNLQSGSKPTPESSAKLANSMLQQDQLRKALAEQQAMQQDQSMPPMPHLPNAREPLLKGYAVEHPQILPPSVPAQNAPPVLELGVRYEATSTLAIVSAKLADVVRENALLLQALVKEKTHILEDESSYQGPMKNGHPHGIGRLIFSLNHSQQFLRYEGNFRDGMRHGTGTLLWTNGDSYEGEFRDNCITGQGVLKRVNLLFHGNFRDGQLQGQGVMTLINPLGGQDVFESDKWENGCLPSGTHTWQGGDRRNGKYVGDFAIVKGFYVHQGRGSMLLDIGIDGRGKEKYKGEFRNDMYHGQGVLKKDPSIVSWSDERDGLDGHIYEGEFKEGKFHGLGILHRVHFRRFRGIWRNGKLENEVRSLRGWKGCDCIMYDCLTSLND